MTYDKRVFTVAVEVTDDGSGKLSATVANDAPEGAMVFVNTYTPPATPPANPPATPTAPTTTVKPKTTARPVPQTGDASVGAAVPIAAATVGLALLGMAARMARRRAES